MPPHDHLHALERAKSARPPNLGEKAAHAVCDGVWDILIRGKNAALCNKWRSIKSRLGWKWIMARRGITGLCVPALPNYPRGLCKVHYVHCDRHFTLVESEQTLELFSSDFAPPVIYYASNSLFA